MTAKQAILEVLAISSAPLAVHEIARQITGVSENNLATRLSELASEKCGKKVEGRTREGKRYKEWFIPSGQMALP